MFPVTITPCVVVSLSKNEPILPSKFIIGGPPLPVTMPVYTQTPNCKYKVLLKDFYENFEFKSVNGQMLINPKASIVSG